MKLLKVVVGQPIRRNNIPECYWTWYSDLEKKYPLVQTEIVRDEIRVCRVKIPIPDITAIKDLPNGKIVHDATGYFLEQTFKPRYLPNDNIIVCP